MVITLSPPLMTVILGGLRGREKDLHCQEQETIVGALALPPLNHYDLLAQEVTSTLWMSTSLAHKGGNKCTPPPSTTSCEDQIKQYMSASIDYCSVLYTFLGHKYRAHFLSLKFSGKE